MIQIYTSVKTIRQTLLLLLLTTIAVLQINAQVTLSFESVINSTTPAGGALNTPIDIVNSGDQTNRLFLVQKDGIIKSFTQNPVAYVSDFLTVTGLTVGGEQGLLSMAFHPDYKNNGYFFVYYNNSNGDVEVARYHTPAGTPNVADPASKKVLLTIPHPTNTNHNGGKLNFGPDGYLYFATGDGGGGGDVPNNAQNGTVLLGKMIRIDVNSEVAPYYTIPADNPFLTVGDNIRDEIWAFGLRNPFRWSFDRLTHDMWIADVGQGAWEEVDFRANGTTGNINYGWHCKEGTHDYNGGCALVAGTGTYAPPLLDYPHDNATGGFAIIGGFVYHGTQQSAMEGYYIFADEVSSNVWLLPPGGAAADTIEFRGALAQISSFGEGEDGELFVTTLNGEVHHVIATAAATLPVKLLSFSGTAKTGYNDLNWQTTDEVQLKQFVIEYSTDAANFEQAGIVAASNNGSYHFTHTITSSKKIYYRLKMADIDGKYTFSKTITLSLLNSPGKNFVTPTIVSNGSINVRLDDNYTGLQIINMDGKTVYNATISNTTGNIHVQIPSVRPGQYLVRLTGNGKQATQKFVVQ